MAINQKVNVVGKIKKVTIEVAYKNSSKPLKRAVCGYGLPPWLVLSGSGIQDSKSKTGFCCSRDFIIHPQ